MKRHHSSARFKAGRAELFRLARLHSGAVVCAECGLTMLEHPPGVNGKPQRWTAGHRVNGSETWMLWTRVTEPCPPGDWLALEMSRCNMSKGAADGNAARNPTSRRW